MEKYKKQWEVTIYPDGRWNKVEIIAGINFENRDDFEQYFIVEPQKIVFLEF